ncbi:Putative NAD(P)-dependent oxidoreductase EC-YbbO [hydrothermal vent metagenome]|uniref:NAD(P)-dependent oxidoreductase EC-YbbO n=1 Tax=hydrothermal vent metagenome TaxID=652676 RepID=A0A3B1BVH9_9ZZZZ
MKNVLITGCSSGIGLCVAHGLKKRGYFVIATARTSRDVDTLKAHGFESVPLDLADSASIRSAVDEALKITGGELYGLFNNGAYGLVGAVEDLSRDAIRDQFEVNLFGTMELTNLLIPVMRAKGVGRIIQNSSVLGFVSLPFRGAYNASKYALEGLSDAMRLELKGSGVRVSIIEPGPIISKFRENAYAAFKKYIDPERSFHRKHYEKTVERLTHEGPVMRGTLPPEAVLEKVIHALESPRPKIRYYVTIPTHIAAMLKRLLPHWMMDRVIGRKG